jgi:hypothetical protein
MSPPVFSPTTATAVQLIRINPAVAKENPYCTKPYCETR